jgi:hypothetical protein
VKPNQYAEEDRAMASASAVEEEPAPGVGEEWRVHVWRAERLRRLGLPRLHAEVFADLVDWHAVADLVARGCPASVAVKIVR